MDYEIKGQNSSPHIFEQLKKVEESGDLKGSIEEKVSHLSEKFLLVYRKTNDPITSIALKEKRSGFIGSSTKCLGYFS